MRQRILRLLALVLIYIVVAHVLPRPESVDPAAWRITGIFLATIAGLMLRPIAGAALVLMGLMMFVLVGGLPMAEALSGYASPSAWLVLFAMLMARVLRDTGLARRIALLFVRRFGHSSLGVSYALVMSDVTLASGIPSITARSGSIMLPITRSIAELYDSRPGETSRRLGTFLVFSLYQTSVVACAMFLTGQASNVLAAEMAGQLVGVRVTWASWLVAGLVPGLLSCAAVPFVVYRMLPPDVRHTPGAAEYAREEIQRMGPTSYGERVGLGVFVGVIALWVTSQWHSLDVTVVALMGLSVLVLAGVLTWKDALEEHSAWDVFVWYGGLITMGNVLNRTGAPAAFAASVGGLFDGVPWFVVLLGTIVIYFYAHYAFASITAHILAMFAAFLVMLTGLGTPPALAVYALACLSNLTAGLTHYGTTTSPIVFAEGYVTQRDWWRVGFVSSIVNLLIWTTAGFAWWKVLGFW